MEMQLTDQSISILKGMATPTLRAAAVQLNATEDVDRNLEVADRLTRSAAETRCAACGAAREVDGAGSSGRHRGAS